MFWQLETEVRAGQSSHGRQSHVKTSSDGWHGGRVAVAPATGEVGAARPSRSAAGATLRALARKLAAGGLRPSGAIRWSCSAPLRTPDADRQPSVGARRGHRDQGNDWQGWPWQTSMMVPVLRKVDTMCSTFGSSRPLPWGSSPASITRRSKYTPGASAEKIQNLSHMAYLLGPPVAGSLRAASPIPGRSVVLLRVLRTPGHSSPAGLAATTASL